jgi:hypothetical protein
VFCVYSFFSQGKILFDATKAESAGNADWVIDTDFNNIKWNPNACLNCGSFSDESNPQRIPTAAQSGINASTPETYWKGAISAWAIDCVKKGYTVETLPYYGQITYGNTSNAQDLSNYKVFVICEPNILFTTAEKTAIVNYIKNGGGVFFISGHEQNDRNNDGNDSPTIINDFLLNNGQANSAFGFTVDAQDFSQTTSNIPFLPNDSILNGVYGNVSQVKFSGGTSMSLFPSQNSTVRGVVYKTGSNGNNGVMCAYTRYQKGKIGIIGDSSPADDGTGDPNDVLYFGYTGEVNGNHRRLIMNMTVWLAASNSAISVKENSLENDVNVFPNPVKQKVKIETSSYTTVELLGITDALGKTQTAEVTRLTDTALELDLGNLSQGIYFLKLKLNKEITSIKKIQKVNDESND